MNGCLQSLHTPLPSRTLAFDLQDRTLKRAIRFVLGSVVVVPLLLAAQQKAPKGASSGPPPGTPGPGSDLAGFTHAVEVQADAFEVSQYRVASQSTKEAKQQAETVARLAPSASAPSEVNKPALTLLDAVDEALRNHAAFVHMLSQQQTAGLKKLLKEMNKADTALARQQKSLDQEVHSPATDPKRLANEADATAKVLAEFQSCQTSLAKEMGIPNP